MNNEMNFDMDKLAQMVAERMKSEMKEVAKDVGEQIQAIGNVAAVAGILNKNEQTSQLLGKQGDLLQLVGIGVTINTQRKQTLLETISIKSRRYSNYLGG